MCPLHRHHHAEPDRAGRVDSRHLCPRWTRHQERCRQTSVFCKALPPLQSLAGHANAAFIKEAHGTGVLITTHTRED